MFIISAPASASVSQLDDRLSKGFKYIEVKTFENLQSHFEAQVRNLTMYMDHFQYISVHAPAKYNGKLVDIASSDQETLELSLLALHKTMELAHQIDCDRVIFHTFCRLQKIENTRMVIKARDHAVEQLKNSLDRLEEDHRNLGVKLCLENSNAYVEVMGQTWYNVLNVLPLEIMRLFDELSLEGLRLTFDTSHGFMACNLYHENPSFQRLFQKEEAVLPAFLENLSNWIEVIHLSDAKGTLAQRGTEGLPIGRGEIDFMELFRIIVSKNLITPLVLEIIEADVNNAIEIAESKNLVVSMLESLT